MTGTVGIGQASISIHGLTLIQYVGDISPLAHRPSHYEDLDSSGGETIAVALLRLLRHFVPRNDNGAWLAMTSESTPHNDSWLSPVYLSDIVR